MECLVAYSKGLPECGVEFTEMSGTFCVSPEIANHSESSLEQIEEVWLAMGKGAVLVEQHPMNRADGLSPQQQCGHGWLKSSLMRWALLLPQPALEAFACTALPFPQLFHALSEDR